ncbi:hypothetical protein KP509_29G016500 [Ceratopteris richardii]|uniref:Uncharacterized protein n=1 Tax=Ceratopteris richardii TaxID=49495 RepID=A0A8T2R7B8_CERRI|nr:hypothetical protein KP509_29G016500 [Ceratopteris richardii]
MHKYQGQSCCASAVVGDKFVVIGGYGAPTVLRTVEVYDSAKSSRKSKLDTAEMAEDEEVQDWEWVDTVSQSSSHPDEAVEDEELLCMMEGRLFQIWNLYA